MSGLGPMVSLLWKELGLAPPVGAIGTEFDFDLGEMAVSLTLEDNGDSVIVRGRLGWLEGNTHEAGDQLARLLRLGLGLAALNGAVLDAAEAGDILERDHEGRVPVHALAMATLATPGSLLPALRALLDWKTATESILAQDGEDSETGNPVPRDGGRGPETEMIIFQP